MIRNCELTNWGFQVLVSWMILIARLTKSSVYSRPVPPTDAITKFKVEAADP